MSALPALDFSRLEEAQEKRLNRGAMPLSDDLQLLWRQIDALYLALRPLAELAVRDLPEETPDHLPVVQIGNSVITLGDLRRARSVCAALERP